MELRELRYFLAVVDAGSIGKAARRLGLTQPALTRSIRTLESDLGVAIFDRSNGGATLNKFGRALEHRARAMLVQSERAREELKELAGASRGRIVVGTSPSFASVILLPHVLPAFRAARPGLEIVIVEGFLSDSLPLLANGEMDFACNPMADGFAASALTSEILVRCERVVPVTNAANPLAGRDRVTLQELQPGPWAFSRVGENRARVSEIYKRHGLAAPEAAIIFNTISLAKEAVRHGPFVTMIARSAIRDEVAAGVFRVVPAPDLVLERSISAFYRSDVALATAARLFLDHIKWACAAEATQFG